jgi:hypothetical protein
MIRPQFIILLVIYLARKQFKHFISAVIGIIGTYFSLLIIWDYKNWLQNGKNHIAQILNYNSGIPDLWPPSLSAGRGLQTVFELFSVENSLTFLIANYAGIVVAIALIIKILITRVNLSNIQFAFLLLPLIFLTPKTSWAYYSCLLLVPLSYILSDQINTFEIGIGSKKRGYLYISGLLLTVSPLCLPIWKSTNIFQNIVPIVWLIIFTYFISGKWETINKDAKN